MDIFNTIIGFINEIGSLVGRNLLMIISVALLLLVIIIQIFVVELSLEAKTARSIRKIEAYLEDHPFISNENIVEFNRLMKRIPKTMRVRWQKYVVNKDNKPSDFMTENECIEKPFKSGGISHTITQFKSILIVISILSFVLCLGTLATSSAPLIEILIGSLLIPSILIVIGCIYLLILKSRQTSLKKRMYLDFTSMINLLDRAVTTFPDFVDYEILFTKKEIDAMIPELQEYLRLRALKEQEELEKAKQSEVEHEDYDFSALGIDGSLVMERAIKECEFYLGNRRKALSAIEQLQSEKDLLSKSYDEKNKNSQRKLRDINETLDRFREKLNSTTNKIVGNDIRRQQAEEIKKQQNLEREIEEDNNRYYEEINKIDEQITAKKAEIDSERKNIEIAFNSEFKAYSDKVYKGLSASVNEVAEQKINTVNSENQSLKQELEDRDQYITEKNVLFDEKSQELEKCKQEIETMKNTISQYEEYRTQAENYMNEKDKEIERKNQEIFSINSNNESLKKNLNIQEKKYKELRKQKFREITRYFDASGNEFFYDEDGMPFFYNEYGDKVYYNRKNIEQKAQDVTLAEDYIDETSPKNIEDNENLNLEDSKIDKEDSLTEGSSEQEHIEEINKNEETLEKDDNISNPIVDDFDDLEEMFENYSNQELESDEILEDKVDIETPEEISKSNPDEELKDLKAAIDAEIEKLNEEHDKLKDDIVNVSKQAEVNVPVTTPKKSNKKKTSQAKNKDTKSSTKNTTASKSKSSKNKDTKEKTKNTKSNNSKTSDVDKKKVSTKSQKKPLAKKTSSTSKQKSADKTKSTKNKPVTKNETKKEIIDLGIEDFGKELSSALKEANKNTKKK